MNYLKYAAIIVVIIGSAVFYMNYRNDTSDYDRFMVSKPLMQLKGGDVKLLVDGIEKIKIQEENSSIQYNSKGNIMIKSGEKVEELSGKIIPSSKFNEVVVPYGKRTYITLSEGTRVWLNSGSRMVYPSVFDGDIREVYLEGEAIFEVAHNPEKPFFVEAKDYKVKVLGTVFNLSSYPDDAYASTALESGKVEIYYKGKSIFGESSTKMTKGTLAVYNRETKTIETQKVDVKNYMSWREGYLKIENQRLGLILKKLSRYYKIDIVLENKSFKETTFSGYLDLKDEIEDVLEVIRITSNISYEKISDNKIIIK